MTRTTPPPLPVDDRDLATCVSCGLCLPACPTWRVTGQEMASPRGRIAAMRAVQWDGAPIDDAFERMMDECVQCRGCEPVCPAFVPFGGLMEGAREALLNRRSRARRAIEWLTYRAVLPRPALLAVLTWALWALQRLRVVPARFGLPRLRARDLARPLRPSPAEGTPVYLFRGCVMDAWMRPIHRAAQAVIEAAGGAVLLPSAGGCCGALHEHAGRAADAERRAEQAMATMPGDAPILVDSAGCGAAMKAYGTRLGTPAARAFSARVLDVHEWLAPREIEGLDRRATPVVVQDPCHLRHVQRSEGGVRAVLGRAYGLIEPDDGGLCCGAGGAYAVLEPRLASDIRDRKVAALRAAGGPEPVVASANPGCVMHLRAAGIDARHPLELLADALGAAEGKNRKDRHD